MPQVYHYDRRPGYTRLVGPGEADLEHLEFGVWRVPRDETLERDLAGQEALLVILSGACQVEVDNESWTLERTSVFAAPAMMVYVPRHRRCRVTGLKPADLAVFTTDALQDYLPRFVDAHEISTRLEGAGSLRRRVHILAGPEFPASRLLVGETYVEPGNWGSYPPHKHDEDRYPDEVHLEEVAFFQIDPPQGFALQYLYSADRSLDQVHVMRNDDLLATARGYHPVAVPPGYGLYYLWGMAGEGRVIRSSLDPAHAWVGEELGVEEAIAVP